MPLSTNFMVVSVDGNWSVVNMKLMLLISSTVVNVKLTLVKQISYLIFVIFFTRAKFLENKIYTEKHQFFALNL